LKFYSSGVQHPYGGGRTEKDIIEWTENFVKGQGQHEHKPIGDELWEFIFPNRNCFLSYKLW